MALSERKAAAARFRERIQRSNELHSRYLKNEKLLDAYDRFTQWQLDYLLQFFDDLYSQDGYRQAIDFTMHDLAGIGIADRDWDLERAAPVFARLLPAGALETLARAARMNVSVLELNIGVTEALLVNGELPDEITERNYWQAYRQTTTLEDCMELVGLSSELGMALRSLVRHTTLGILLRTMRRPAHIAGYGALQNFLETGFHAFRGIPDVDHFLAEVVKRMNRVFDRIHNAPL